MVSIFCDRLRSSAITIAGSQTIAEVCFHIIADDRRTFYDMRSAIRDSLRSYGNQPLESHVEGQMFRFHLIRSAFDLDKHIVTRLRVTTRQLGV